MRELSAEIDHDLLCQSCGYNLRGLRDARCPECGETFDRDALPEAHIPWLRRPAIGNWRAYWQTVFEVMFYPGRIARELWDAPRMNMMQAARFRWCVLAQAIVCAATGCVALSGFSAGVWILIGIAIFLVLATDLSEMLIQSGADRCWRRALHYYACAPLAMTPLVLVFLLLARMDDRFWLIGPALVVLMFAWWWIATVRMLHVTHLSIVSTIGLAIQLPVGWWFTAFVAIICAVMIAALGAGIRGLF